MLSRLWTKRLRRLLALILISVIVTAGLQIFSLNSVLGSKSSFFLLGSLVPASSLFCSPRYLTRGEPLKDTTGPALADPAASHNYHENGLVELNPEGDHPIHGLIRDAEKNWEGKLERASKTLEQAVGEYKRRYNRPPPKGFNDWWDYVVKNNVQLPDEYDFISRDLEPFWGIAPEDLLEIQAAQEDVPDSFTIGKTGSAPSKLVKTAFSTPKLWRERALLRGVDEILDLLKPIDDKLPQFRIIFSPHDNPNLLSDYHVKKTILDAARSRTHVDISKLPETTHLGFASACAPGSPGRPVEAPVDQYNRPPPRANKTFIHDHRLSMDPCLHPNIFYNHSQYVAHDLGPKPQPVLAAQFAYCSTPLYHDLQPPSFISWVDDVKPRGNDPPWENKTDERLMWRGSNTGMNHDKGTRWIYSQRIRLVGLANKVDGTERVLMETGEGMRVGEGVALRKAVVNPALMDIAFTGQPIGCFPEEYCDYMETLFEWRRPQDANGKDVGNHKYLVDVDGNGWSSRFKRLITSNSLIFKAAAYPEWWLDRIQPWVHYVPVQVDYSDLYDAYIFFRGGLYGEGNHDHMARKIAIEGREWSLNYWRKEDMTAYFFRMLLEYARLMSLDRDSMNYVG